MNTAARTPGRDRWIPWAFVAVFAVVLAANGLMATLAMTSWTGLVDEDAYGSGLRFNETLDADAAQRALGWRVTPRFVPGTVGHGGALTLTVADAGGRPLVDATVTAAIRRPLVEGFDTTLALAPRESGVYGVDLDLPMPGQWDVEILIAHDGATYRMLRRLDVP